MNGSAIIYHTFLFLMIEKEKLGLHAENYCCLLVNLEIRDEVRDSLNHTRRVTQEGVKNMN